MNREEYTIISQIECLQMFAVAERFIRALKSKIYKHMTAISKKFYFDVLNYIVDEYNSTYYKTIKMKPIDVESDYFAEYNEESNDLK